MTKPKPETIKAAIRDVREAVSFAQMMPNVTRRADRADAVADILIDGIADGAFTLTTAYDAARVAKLMVEIARLDRGQATTITAREAPTTPEERLARFRELQTVIDTGETPSALTA